MKPIAMLAWASFIGAAIFAFSFLNTGVFVYISAAISCCVAGVLFLAIQQIIDLLTDIRDTLYGNIPAVADPTVTHPDAIAEPTGNLSDLQSKIDKLKANSTK